MALEVTDPTKNKNQRSKTPEQMRNEVSARFNEKNRPLLAIHDDLKKSIEWEIEALRNSQAGGFGYKQEQADENAVKKLAELTLALTRLTKSKTDLDKHLKKFADDATPEEDLAAVVSYIHELPVNQRQLIITQLVRFHNSQCGGLTGLKVAL